MSPTMEDVRQFAATDGGLAVVSFGHPDLRAVFIAAGGSHEDWAEHDRVVATERRTAVFIHPTRITAAGRP